MTTISRRALPLLLAPLLMLADVGAEQPLGLGIRSANAIIGAPLTPLSYAGVARRTTRRAVYATTAMTTAAVTTAAATQSAAAQAAASQAASSASAANAAAQAARAGGPPVGSIVPALPSGCTPTTKGNVEYFVCGNTWYRAAFQGNNLVYVVQAP